jgi:uncharacterized protein (DUF1501 family)
MTTRRAFMKSSGLALVSFGFAPGFVQRAAAAAPGKGKRVLVVVFQRGGADGLSMVPPYGDPDYAPQRPSLALPAPGSQDGVLKLDDTFGLHPALAPLEPLYAAGTLAVLHAVGSPKPTRSHFDAQDFMEAGTPGLRGNEGWLNRVLASEPKAQASTFRAVALEPTLPRSLLGNAPAVAMNSLGDFRLQAGARVNLAMKGFEDMYASAVDEAMRSTGAETFEALRAATDGQLASRPPENGAEYPKSPLGKRMQDIARLIHADVGLEIATTDCGGWDTHIGQGAAQGQLAQRLKDFADSLAAFAKDLGPKLADVCVVTMTEFGRTVHENGNRGTDHGTASVMLAFGGGIRGKRVKAQWKGLSKAALFEERDLAVGTDYREVLAELVEHHLGVRDPIFPDFKPTPMKLLFASSG